MSRALAFVSLAMLTLTVPSESIAAQEAAAPVTESDLAADNGAQETTATAVEDAAQEPSAEEPAGKLSGLVYFDWYSFPSSHLDEVEGQTGFWFRRIYLTYDRKLGGDFDARLRLEMNSAGDFESGGKMNTFVKDAWLRWKGEQTSVIVGMSGTPTWGLIESFWGYRSVEKTPLDLQRWSQSRDIGVAVKGTLGASKRLSYHVMGGNGNGTNAEVTPGKSVSASLGYQLTDELVVEVYGEYNKVDDDRSRTTYQAFAGYASGGTKVGAHYAHQTIKRTGLDATDADLLSVFWTQKLSEKFGLLLRGDRMFDPNPIGDKIQYLPFDTASRAFFVLAGLDYDLGHNIHLIPNVEYITYQPVDEGREVRDDLAFRFTFHWEF